MLSILQKYYDFSTQFYFDMKFQRIIIKTRNRNCKIISSILISTSNYLKLYKKFSQKYNNQASIQNNDRNWLYYRINQTEHPDKEGLSDMKAQTMNKLKSKVISKKWPIFKFVQMSYISQNMYLNHPLFIFMFLITQTVLNSILPMLALIPTQSSYLVIAKPFCKLICTQIMKYFQQKYLLTLFQQLFIMTISLSLLLILLTTKNKKTVVKALKILPVFHQISIFLIFLQTQTIMILSDTEQKSQLSKKQIFFLLKTVCVLNIILIIILSTAYKLIYHTYSTVIYNHLCTRFDIVETIVVVSARFLAIFAPYIVWTAFNENQKSKDHVTAAQVFYNLGLLCLCFIKLKSQLQHFTYFSAMTTNIYQYCLTLQFSVLMVSLISVVSKETLIIQNSLYVILSLWFFSVYTIRAFKKKQHEDCQLLSLTQISNQILAQRFIIQLNEIFNQGDSIQQPFILLNLKRIHQSSCQKIDCFCKNSGFNQIESIFQYDKCLIIQTMDNITQKFNGNIDLILMVSCIKLNVHKVFADTLWKLNKINQNTIKYSYKAQILIQKYILNLKNFLESKNNQLNIASSQKCIESDETVTKLVHMYENMISLKIQFWNYFTKGNVMHTLFQKKINDQLALMKQFYSLNKIVLYEFSYNYLLVSLLMGYEKFILLKDKLSKQILDRANALRIRNTKAHSFKRERNEKISVQKWIYSQSSCTFETIINMDQMGIIAAASKNVQAVFGYSSKALKGVNINKIMPSSMQQEHDYLLSSWAKKCSWTNIGVFRNIFCVNRDNICFSSGIYLKLVQRFDSINIIGSVFKENDKDFMIIDNKGLIVGAGYKFFTLLGSLIVGLPISFICSDADNIRKWSQSPQKLIHKSLFYSTRKCQSVIQKYLSRKYAIGSVQTSGSQNIIPQLKQLREKDEEVQGHLIEYEVYPYQIGRILFSVIKIESVQTETNIKKMGCISTNIEQSVNKGIQEQQGSSMKALDLDPNFLACNSSTGASSTQSSIQSMQNNLECIESLFYQKQKVKDRKVYKTILSIIIFCLLGIFVCSGKLYINYKGFDELQQFFFADGACSDNLQLSMLIFNQATTLQRVIQQFQQQIQSKSVSPYEGVVELNSGIKDIMMYDRFKQQYVHDLVLHQFQSINTQKTSLTMTRMFEYQKKTVKWIFSDGSDHEILTTNFMINFLYLADSINRETEAIKSIFNEMYISNTSNVEQQGRLTKSKENIEHYMYLFYINFPELQRINLANLQLYLSLSQKTNTQIEIFGYAKIAGMMALLSALLFCMNRHYSFRQEQYMQIFSQYKQISLMNVSALHSYFSKLRTTLKSGIGAGMENSSSVSNAQMNISCQVGKGAPVTSRTVRNQHNAIHINTKLLEIQNNFQELNLDLTNKLSIARTKLSIIGEPFKTRAVVFTLLLMIVGSLNVSMVVVEKKILKTSSQMMNDINGLMNSENQMMQAYFIFKAYHTNLNNKYDVQLAKRLLSVVNQTESNFNKVAVHSITLFSQFDDNYEEKMIRILTINICEHTKQIFPLQFNDKCEQEMRLLHSGVIQSMNYFFRQLQESLHHYILLSGTNSTSDQALIASISSLDSVDKTIIYMFKMYQQTQAQITTSLIIALNNQNLQYQLQIAVQFIILFGLLLFIPKFYRIQVQDTANRIGRIFLLPVKMLKNNRKMMKSFEKIIDYYNVR